MFPSNSQKRMMDRLNRSIQVQSKVTIINNQEKVKKSIIKKVIMISSIKPEAKKNLIKLLQGSKLNQTNILTQIINYSKSILDNDKQKILNQELNSLVNENGDCSSLMFSIIKQLVISPIQKSYITKIQKQLKEEEILDIEIKQIQSELQDQKINKIKQYQMHKSGVHYSTNNNLSKSSFRQGEHFENKLMRANQKLNELATNNNKLRQKINQLRKQKNSMEDIYNKLKKQLQQKKQNVQKTIKFAGDAYCARNKAEQDLKSLKEQSQIRKQQFRQECQRLNKEIQHDLHFKQFIKSKQLQRQQLEQLQKQIDENQYNIELKKQQNYKIDQQYKKSLQKQLQIKQAFDKIKKQIGYNEVNGENKQLLNIFVNLYEKNIVMKQFVRQIAKQVEQLQKQIQIKKNQIHNMYLKGSPDQVVKEKIDQQLKNKFIFHQKKKKILENQLEKSTNTIQTIKKYLQDIFQQIGIDPQITQKLKNCNLNEQNLTQFLGQLQKKGLQAISHYGKLISEQLRAQKGSNWQIQKQIQQLNNIITLQNVNNMNTSSINKQVDYPSQLIIKAKQDKSKEQQHERPLTTQDFKRYALDSIQNFQKKQQPKQKNFNKKYALAQTVSKTKKK